MRRLWLFTCCCLAASALHAETVRVGVLAIRGDEPARQRWAPTVAGLSARLDGYEFVLVPHDLSSIVRAVEHNTVDFVVTNPGNYIELESRYGASRVATLKNRFGGGSYTRFGAVLFTLRGRDDIESIADLRGKRFAAVDQRAFGGYQMAAGELARKGIDPKLDFSNLEFTGFPQELVVKRVLHGAADAGTVRTEVLESMAADGRIDLAAIKVLGRRQVSGFDMLLSTPLYPEWTFARLRDTSDALAAQVAVALFMMPPEQRGSWTAPLDYTPVHRLFRELHIGPYVQSRREILLHFLRMNRNWLVSAGLVAMMMLLVVLLILRSNRRLARSRARLRCEVAERERTEAELERHRESLEARVEQRTGELHALNKALQQDVVQRVQAERALSRSRALLKDLHDNFARLDADHDVRIQGLLAITRSHFGCQAVALVRIDGQRIEPVFDEQGADAYWHHCIVRQVQAYARSADSSESDVQERCHVRLLPVTVAVAQCAWVLAFASHRVASEAAEPGTGLHADAEVFSVITLLAGSELDRRTIELDLDQQRTRLATVSRLSALGQMTTELAHELNQPLTGAANFATGCLYRLRQPEPVLGHIEQGLSRTVEAIERAAAIVRGLRERVQKSDCRAERVNLCSAVHTTVRLIAPQADARGIEIRTDLETQPIWVKASSVQLEQVLMNLLGNAVTSPPDPGKLTRPI